MVATSAAAITIATTCSRRKRRLRMGTRKTFRLIVVLWHALLTVSGTCLAYTATPLKRARTTAIRTFGFRSTPRVLLQNRRARPIRRSMTRSRTTEDDEVTLYSGFSTEEAKDSSGRYDDWLFDDRRQRVAFYGSLAFLETIFWYWLAPGIDPQSRWFNPSDGKLIASLLDPSTVFSPQAGSGLGFSSLLLNTFLILPMVWSLLLLQEREETKDDSAGRFENGTVPRSLTARSITSVLRNCACAGGFLVGGGILIPYMIVRPPLPFRESICPAKFPIPLRLFEEQSQQLESASKPMLFAVPTGPVLLLVLALVVLITFLIPFANHHTDWIVEWNAFTDRACASQFTALALYDLAMISITILDPMMDDAIRRGYVDGWDSNNDDDVEDMGLNIRESKVVTNRFANRDQWRIEQRNEALRRLAPFVAVPLIGPVAWIWSRPRYSVGTSE